MRRICWRPRRPTPLTCLALLLAGLTVLAAAALVAALVAAAPATAAETTPTPAVAAPATAVATTPTPAVAAPATAVATTATEWAAIASGSGGAVWDWPVRPPEVLRGFDPPVVRWKAGHRGVDLAASAGQPVRSAGAGVVTYAGALAGRGVVAVTHGALRTTYEPVSASVRVGQRVTRGQVLGRLAAGPGHCSPQVCLHWGLLRGEDYLNPLALLRRGSSRLLPVWHVPAPVNGRNGATPAAPRASRSSSARLPAVQAGAVVSGGLAAMVVTLAAVHRSRSRGRGRR